MSRKELIMRSLLNVSPLTQASATRPAIRTQDWVPAVDVIEDNDAFIVRVNVPGYSKEDLSISLENERLEIRGERAPDTDQPKYLHRERRSGAFLRTFRIGRHVDPNTIHASYTDGVLEVRVGKLEDAKPRLINVQ